MSNGLKYLTDLTSYFLDPFFVLILEFLRIFIEECLRNFKIGGTARTRVFPPSKIELFSKSIEPDQYIVAEPHTCIPNLSPLFIVNRIVVLRTNGATVGEE